MSLFPWMEKGRARKSPGTLQLVGLGRTQKQAEMSEGSTILSM